MTDRWLLAAVLLAFTAGCSKTSTLEKDGGVVLVYEWAEQDKTPTETVVAAIEQRLGYLVNRGQLQVKDLGEGQVEVTLIGVSDQELNTAKEAMRAKGELEFRILALRGEDDALIAAAEAGTALPDESKPFAKWTDYDPQKNSLPDGVVTREREGKHQVLVIDDELDVTAELLDYAQPMLEESGWQVAGKFNPQGAERMGKLTKRNLPRGDKMRQLGIILDGELLTAPSIQAEFSRYFQLTGNFTEDEVRLMAAVLKLGKFPAHIKPDPISEKRVAPER